MTARAFTDTVGSAPVRGFLHEPRGAGASLVLTHGAGGSCEAPLLVRLAEALADAGVAVLRCDLPFRQARPRGGPPVGSAARDQQGLRRAVELLRERFAGPVLLGGQSYGGRQASMLAAEAPRLVDGLLLLSYPLHPPGKAAQLRTAHFPQITTPSLFIHGTKDPFGTIAEFETALPLIPARTRLVQIEGAGHGLLTKNNAETLLATIVAAFRGFLTMER